MEPNCPKCLSLLPGRFGTILPERVVLREERCSVSFCIEFCSESTMSDTWKRARNESCRKRGVRYRGKTSKKRYGAGVLYLFRREKLRRVQRGGTLQRTVAQHDAPTEQAQPAERVPGVFSMSSGDEGGLSAGGEKQSTPVLPARCS